MSKLLLSNVWGNASRIYNQVYMHTIKHNHSIVFMGSGKGSTIKRLCEMAESGKLQTNIKALITDNPHSEIIVTAKKYEIPVFILPFKESQKSDWDKSLLKILLKLKPDLIFLAGFLRKIGPKTLSAFQNKIINTHPSLLPEFGGKGMYGLKVHKAVCENQKKETGVTLHFVNENYDKGPKIAQKSLQVLPNDTPHTLQERVKRMEKQICGETLQKIISGEISLPLSFKEMTWLFLKGAILGLSSALPGISGGTAAFLLGIYEKLVSEVSKIKIGYFFKLPFYRKYPLTESYGAFTFFSSLKFYRNHPLIKNFDWPFLMTLFSGAAITVFLFALLASPFIKTAPKAFKTLVFFLVLISLYFPLRNIKKTFRIWLLIIGTALFSAALFYSLKDSSLFSKSESVFWLFPAGLLAGPALVLPGLSGSYLLILFGIYENVLEAIKDLHIVSLVFFTSGVSFGGILMARFMKHLLNKYFHETSGVIIGLILGSLFLLQPF